MNYSIIREIENEQLKPEVTEFNVGDTVKVYAKVVEGTRERLGQYILQELTVSKLLDMVSLDVLSLTTSEVESVRQLRLRKISTEEVSNFLTLGVDRGLFLFSL